MISLKSVISLACVQSTMKHWLGLSEQDIFLVLLASTLLSLCCSLRKSRCFVTAQAPAPLQMTQLPWIGTLLMAAMCPFLRLQSWIGPGIIRVQMAFPAMAWDLSVERARVSLLALVRWRRKKWTASLRCLQIALFCGAPCALFPPSGDIAGVLGRMQPAMQKWTSGGKMEPVHFIIQSVFSFGKYLLYCYWFKKKKEETLVSFL